MLYFEVRKKMEEQFMQYIRTPYNGPDAPIKKATAYDKIDYTSAHHLIDEYKSKNEIKNMLTETTNEDGQKGKNNGIKN